MTIKLYIPNLLSFKLKIIFKSYLILCRIIYLCKYFNFHNVLFWSCWTIQKQSNIIKLYYVGFGGVSQGEKLKI